MSRLKVNDDFPRARLLDIEGGMAEFPAVFAQVPATVVFFYRGRW